MTRSAFAANEDTANDLDSTTSAEEQAAADLVGTWELHDKGLRTITVNPDGSASMEVQLSSVGSWIYGRRFTMELEWSLDGDVLSYSIVGGRPERSIERVISNYGEDYEYRIVNLSDEAIALEDLSDPGTVYEWASVNAIAAAR